MLLGKCDIDFKKKKKKTLSGFHSLVSTGSITFKGWFSDSYLVVCSYGYNLCCMCVRFEVENFKC